MVNIQENRGREWLKSAGVRPTRQRLTLAELLIGDGLNRHVCAEPRFKVKFPRLLFVISYR